MPLTLPNLDDRRWADLVEESRALIPVYGGEWTDHNVSDPGITIVELLAYIAEMDLFELNQITDAHKRKFLSLIGMQPEPPRAAKAVLKFGLDAATPTLDLPAGLAFTTAGTEPVRFQTREAITVVAGDVAALQLAQSAAFQDLTSAWRRGEPVTVFGANPVPEASFYVGFSAALPVGKQVNLYFYFAGDQSLYHERERIEKEAAVRALDCQPPAGQNPCVGVATTPANPPAPEPAAPLVHPSVRAVWEFWADDAAQGQWVALRAAQDHLVDETRSFTLNGSVRFQLPSAMRAQSFGTVASKLCYLRCRFVSGVYDAAPLLLGAVLNSVFSLQITPLNSSLRIAPGAQILGTVPNPGDRVQLKLQLDNAGRINQLTFGGGATGDPKFLILSYRAATSTEGSLQIEAAYLGRTTGFPYDQFVVPNAPVMTRGFRLFSLSGSGWQEWQWRADLESSLPRDTQVILSPTDGKLQFGDGENGLVPDAGSLLFVVADNTLVEAGNVVAHSVSILEDSPHNRAELGTNWAAVSSHLKIIDNPFSAQGGASAETPDQASLRAIQLINGPTRAVTVSDYEQFALTTPGTRMARALAIPDFHDHFPCFMAPGVVTVVVVPFLPAGAPSPSSASRRAIASYLNRRRIVGTRIRVVAPQYVEVSVQASVQAIKGVNRTTLQARIVARLQQFLDPLVGGENGEGWPFGRHVYAPDLLSVIADVPGVDHVLAFAFTGGCTPPCNEICVGRAGLVKAGTLSIEVA
jgi:hypothetical protein